MLKRKTVEQVFSEIKDINQEIERLVRQREVFHDIAMSAGEFESADELTAAYIGWIEKKRDI